jgi:spermidine synthase
MNVRFQESDQSPDPHMSFRVRSVLHRVQSAYQEVVVYDTVEFGRMLALDDIVMTTERDEFFYHEMIVHVPLAVHPAPRRVVVVGGGDGGAVREVLRHPTVEEVVLAEIDAEVIAASRRHLPSIACALDDPRVRVEVGDGVAYLASCQGAFDAIVVDAPDPVGPAVGLFAPDFYRAAARALRPGGVFSAQGESPFLHADVVRAMQAALRAAFPVVRLYWGVVPSYPGGLWSYAFASLGPDPLTDAVRPVPGTRYWSPEIHRAAVVLPPFARALVGDGPQAGSGPAGGR